MNWFKASPRWESLTYWALDLETSGLTSSDQILSLGLVPVRGGVIGWGGHWYTLVRPERPESLSTEGIEAHHIRPGELRGAPPLAEVLEGLERRVGADPLLLHYAQVDVGFLQRAYQALGRRRAKPTVVDTVVLLAKLAERRRRFDPYAKGLPANLREARAALGLPDHTLHHALYDALATAELFLVLRHRLGAKTLRDLL